jgi:hypothetical protein
MSKAFSGEAWRLADNWGFWFRIFGRGLHVTNSAPVFSERYGYTKSFRIFGVKIKYLPNNLVSGDRLRASAAPEVRTGINE